MRGKEHLPVRFIAGKFACNLGCRKPERGANGWPIIKRKQSATLAGSPFSLKIKSYLDLNKLNVYCSPGRGRKTNDGEETCEGMLRRQSSPLINAFAGHLNLFLFDWSVSIAGATHNLSRPNVFTGLNGSNASSPRHPSLARRRNQNGPWKTEDGSQSAKGYLEIKKSLLSKLEG